jgi:hypothetical protein
VDHLRAIDQAGFEVVEVDASAPMVDTLGPIHPEFERYPREELATPEAWIVARSSTEVAERFRRSQSTRRSTAVLTRE